MINLRNLIYTNILDLTLLMILICAAISGVVIASSFYNIIYFYSDFIVPQIFKVKNW